MADLLMVPAMFVSVMVMMVVPVLFAGVFVMGVRVLQFFSMTTIVRMAGRLLLNMFVVFMLVMMLMPMPFLMLVCMGVFMLMLVGVCMVFVTFLVVVVMMMAPAIVAMSVAVVVPFLMLILLVRMRRTSVDAELGSLHILPLVAFEMHVKVADLELGKLPFKCGRFHAEIAECAYGHVATDAGEAIEEEDFHEGRVFI